jgi:DNA-3-methyladenine glycosylase
VHVPLAKPLPVEFFARDSLRVARDLLGCRFSHGGVTVRLTEVEAYDGAADPGSHAFLGRSPRNEVMFGPAGRLYVYFTYGMHFCMNAVCGRPGEGTAVLLRAGEPLEGVEGMRARRARERTVELCSGPGRFTQALGVTRSEDGADLVDGRSLWLERASRPEAIETGIRVGVHETTRPWRYWLEGNPFVSRGRPGPPTPKARPSRVSSVTP